LSITSLSNSVANAQSALTVETDQEIYDINNIGKIVVTGSVNQPATTRPENLYNVKIFLFDKDHVLMIRNPVIIMPDITGSFTATIDYGPGTFSPETEYIIEASYDDGRLKAQTVFSTSEKTQSVKSTDIITNTETPIGKILLTVKTNKNTYDYLALANNKDEVKISGNVNPSIKPTGDFMQRISVHLQDENHTTIQSTTTLADKKGNYVVDDLYFFAGDLKPDKYYIIKIAYYNYTAETKIYLNGTAYNEELKSRQAEIDARKEYIENQIRNTKANPTPGMATLLIFTNTGWSGSILDSGLDSSTKDGEDDTSIDFECQSGGTYSLSFQKQTDYGYLMLSVIQGGKELDSEYTNAQYGVISLAGKCISSFGDIGSGSGGCLIATATYGSELTPQVQMLRETRDNVVMQTRSGVSFMTAFNSVYYTFAPTVAEWERENPVFKEIVKVTITPLITTLSILNYLDIDSEAEMLGYGIGVIALNIGMYFIAPAFVIMKIKSRKK